MGEKNVPTNRDPEEAAYESDDDDAEIFGKTKAISCAKAICLFLLIIISVYSLLAYIIANESKKNGSCIFKIISHVITVNLP